MTQRRFSADRPGLISPEPGADPRSSDPLKQQAKALQSKRSRKMGRLRFELRTNRLKANWTSLRSLPVQGLLKAPPNTPPNKSAATDETILAESALERPQERDIKREDHRGKSSRLPSPAIPHRSTQRQPGQDAQPLAHRPINPPLRPLAEQVQRVWCWGSRWRGACVSVGRSCRHLNCLTTIR